MTSPRPQPLRLALTGSERYKGAMRSSPKAPEARAMRTRLNRAMGRALGAFDMLTDGDRVMCAVSGGKDSDVMHDLLVDLSRRAPVRFEVVAVNIDQGHPGYPAERLEAYMADNDYAFRLVREDTYTIVKANIPEGKTMCSLCSRLRRGILYTLAREMGCNKIALGHHRDDIITTLMLNLFFQGALRAMPPKLTNDAGDVVVVRPLAYCAEDDIRAYAEMRAYPIIPCDLCGSQPNHQRRVVSDMLAEVERNHPGIRDSMIAAVGNITPSHLLDPLVASVAPAEENAPSLVQLRRPLFGNHCGS